MKLAYPLAQPAKAVIAQRRISVKALADAVPVTTGYLGRGLNGYIPLSPRVRHRVAEVLGLPEDELFFPTSPEPRYPGDLVIGAAG
jgi:transcriptional regulator with XRE-family HTH domain